MVGSWKRGKFALPNLFGFVVVRNKCCLIFQLTITVAVDLSLDNKNCLNTDQLTKWWKEEDGVGRLYGLVLEGQTSLLGEKSISDIHRLFRRKVC